MATDILAEAVYTLELRIAALSPETLNRSRNPAQKVRVRTPGCRRSGAKGAKGIRTPDLLDANETNWAFADVDCVGLANNQQVKRLAALAT